jgi:hypothetical protein
VGVILPSVEFDAYDPCERFQLGFPPSSTADWGWANIWAGRANALLARPAGLDKPERVRGVPPGTPRAQLIRRTY